MSGHSKWSTIKRQKAVNDNARGKVFGKMVKAITVAAREGGPNPDSNYKLRIAIEAARAENMPGSTIDRAINKAASSAEKVEEITYEGFGPGGVALMVQVTTDNRNRTVQEIKHVFERGGGSMGQPGSVSFNFELSGYLLVKKGEDVDTQTLNLIDLGASELEDIGDGIEVYVSPTELFSIKEKIEQKGYAVLKAELIQKPKVEVPIGVQDKKKLAGLLELFDEHDDVQNVFDNASFSG